MTQPIQCCYSPHEEHIMAAANGDTSYKKGRERIYKILDRNQNLKPVIDAERAKYFTESMAQTEGEHLTLRWAKALMNIAKKHHCLYRGRQLTGRSYWLPGSLWYSVS